MTNTYQLTLADIASQEAAYVETIFHSPMVTWACGPVIL